MAGGSHTAMRIGSSCSISPVSRGGSIGRRDADGSCRTPAVSPDGRQILFQLFRDGAWLLDVSSGTMRQLLADPSAEEFAWSADGQRVAYHSRRSGRWSVWLASAE